MGWEIFAAVEQHNKVVAFDRNYALDTALDGEASFTDGVPADCAVPATVSGGPYLRPARHSTVGAVAAWIADTPYSNTDFAHWVCDAANTDPDAVVVWWTE